jgi:hypothetical protein
MLGHGGDDAGQLPARGHQGGQLHVRRAEGGARAAVHPVEFGTPHDVIFGEASRIARPLWRA